MTATHDRTHPGVTPRRRRPGARAFRLAGLGAILLTLATSPYAAAPPDAPASDASAAVPAEATTAPVAGEPTSTAAPAVSAPATAAPQAPSSPPSAQAPNVPASVAPLGASWGIEVIGLNLSAANYMLDLRYRVTDHQKASRYFNHKTAPHLLDPATGAILFIPSNAKLGKMRQVPVEGDSRRVYFVLFANPGRYIKEGTPLTLVSGEDKLEGLVVGGDGNKKQR